jgi:hypothetical protein
MFINILSKAFEERVWLGIASLFFGSGQSQ